MQAIGSSAAASYARISEGDTGLQAQLSRLEKELSACVNCATATTTEGKAKIEAVSTRIAQVQARIAQSEEAEQNKPAARTFSRSKNPEQIVNTDSGLSIDPTTRLGSLIDTQA
jgi:hypothetical protein